MHALGMAAMLRREGVVVVTGQPGFPQPGIGQPGLGYSQPGYGPSVQGQPGYVQPVGLDGYGRPGYGQLSPVQPGLGSQSAPSAPYHGTTDGALPPSYNETKEKF